METELIVVTSNSNASLDLLDDLPVSLNFAIADIKDPSTRNGAFSKSIKLPGSATNNTFFEHIYDVNIVTNKFNPNLKTPCYVLQDSIEVFRGYLRLREIEVELVNDTKKITYDVTLLGDNQTLFGVIGDAKLQDLDMSSFNHVYNRVNQKSSWTGTLGSGYVYPLIDYGYNSFLTNSFKVEHFRPAFYVKEYIDRIFAAAGKTYTSSFFNSTFFKRWIIPHNGDKFSMGTTNLANYECFVGSTGAFTSNTKNLVLNNTTIGEWTSNDSFVSTASTYTMVYNDETTSPFVDVGNIYNNTTGILTIAQTGNYNLNFITDFEIKFSAVPAGTASISVGAAGKWALCYKVLKSTDGGATWNIIYSDTSNYPTTVITTSYQTISKIFGLPPSTHNIGDQIRVCVHPLYYNTAGFGIKFLDGGGNKILAGTATMDWRFRSSATFKNSMTVGDYVSGNNLVANDAIPRDIKQKDFLISIFRLGRLYVDEDPNDVNNYLIETRNDFYAAGGEKDWSDKLALDHPFTIGLMAELDIKNFIYRYKSDQDYYNKQYEDTYGEPYGTYKKVVENDFTLKDNITDVIFSPTPIVDNTNNSMIIPKIFSYDGTSVKPQKHNIRILMYNGVETMTSGSWDYVAPVADSLGAATLSMGTYPRSAMVNNQLNPTESIEFGVPNTVFYSPQTYTTNNIYNSKYSKEVTELTDRESRIVTAYFYLTPLDIALFDFRDKIFVKDTYYFVNKISDYNKLKPGLTKVELLKIKNVSDYEPTSGLEIGTLVTNSTNVGMTARYAGSNPNDTNIGNANNVIIGDNNSSRSVASFISGSRNSVSPNAYRVSVISTSNSNVGGDTDGINLVGCSGINVGKGASGIILINCTNTTIDEYVYNFTGTNLNGETIDVSQSGTIKNGIASNIPIKNRAISVDSNFTVSKDYDTYYVDATSGGGGGIIATIVDTGIEYTIIKTDATANTVVLTPVVGTISGSATLIISTQYTSRTIAFDGSNWFRK